MKNEPRGCVCTEQCAQLFAPERIPPNCPSLAEPGLVERARKECRREDSEARRLWKAFARLVGHGGASRSRLEHIMEFSSAAGYRKIGLAGCARYVGQMHLTRKLLRQHGFESVAAACKLGNNRFADIGIDKDSDWQLCNPVGQALLLNDFGADLNVVFGLCMGHDLIFQHYSDAPVTTLVVKEKISDDNPVATLGRMASGEYEPCPYLPGPEQD